MHMKLGGWTQMGLVASVLWILIAGFLSQSANVNQALYLRGIEMRSCIETTYAKGSRDLTLCEKQAGELYDAYMHNRWVDTAIIALAPIPFAWFTVWLIVVVTRWVRRGFQAQN